MGAFSFLVRYHSPSAREKEEGLVAAPRKNRGCFFDFGSSFDLGVEWACNEGPVYFRNRASNVAFSENLDLCGCEWHIFSFF